MVLGSNAGPLHYVTFHRSVLIKTWMDVKLIFFFLDEVLLRTEESRNFRVELKKC